MPEQLPLRTAIRYWTGARVGAGKRSRTRTIVQPLGGEGGTPVVWVEGEGGCISMTHIEVVPPKRIQRCRAKGWRMPPEARYVGRGRGCKYGNPIRITPERSRHHGRVEVMYRVHGSPTDVCGGPSYALIETARHFAVKFFEWDLLNGRFGDTYPSLEDIRCVLAGWDLACWCPLGQPCHGDVLLEVANGAAV